MINTSSFTTIAQDPQLAIQKMEVAARNVDKSLSLDCNALKLTELLNVSPQTGSTASGLVDLDYPSLNCMPASVNTLTQIKNVANIPLPPEIVDHFNHVQCHCMMGLFPEIDRAWLTVDSDIYIWTYEENTDLAYFDGINETILCVGLVKPKPGVFHAFIKYLLVLTTAVDVVVLGVTFTEGATGEVEINLIPDPVFTLPTDGNTITTIASTATGRLFCGTKEGSVLEIAYQAVSGWFGKRCKMVNLSTSALSFLVPSFLNAALNEEDSIVQISIDDTRNILYTLTEKGAIEVCDLGEKGNGFSRITKVAQTTLVTQAMNTVKTLDSQNFRPIVSISAVDSHESSNVNLVAITQTGVRFYLTVASLSNQQPNQRPYTLTLMHVRLPPGYSANITVRPRNVHMAHYRDRNVILISNVKDKDVLWCMSSDLFPSSQSLMEAYSSMNLDGPALALAEVKTHDPLNLEPHEILPPVVARQHAEPPKKYVVLTSHCVQVFLKLRPVDLLKQILKDSHGQDTTALKSFFTIQSESQACATALILACLESPENAEIAELATRAFFLFGGEPQMAQQLNQTHLFSGTMFSPNIISTPAQSNFHNQNSFNQSGLYPQLNTMQPAYGQSGIFDPSNFINFSAKHNGLYLYLCRILRPLWNRRCVDQVTPDGKNFIYQSSVTVCDCTQILGSLGALHNFLKMNTQLSCVNTSVNGIQRGANVSLNVTQNQPTAQDLQLEERQSLDALKTFVSHCCQIVGLWRIFCEHYELVGSLSENQQQILQATTFKELFLYRQDICSFIIKTLVDSYLGDNASVDSISAKLIEICPELYKPEDAAYSKANELLKATRSVQNLDEKDGMVISALQLCKNIAPNLNLSEICRQFITLKAYKAVTELCAHCAMKIDPEKIAESYFNASDEAVDQDALDKFQRRMEVYKEIVLMLETLYNEQPATYSPSTVTPVDVNDSRSLLIGTVESSKLSSTLQLLVDDILMYDDDIMHIALYEWMVSKQMTNDLIKIQCPSLEKYLKRSTTQNPNNIPILDLLWKYYESKNNHTAAARILNKLASKSGNNLTLKDRLTYLARGIICLRSDSGGFVPQPGVYLRDLEDKMEVAKVQEMILEALSNLRGQVANIEEAIVALDSGLFEISQLYENFAEPFNLLECQLAIIDCAGYTDEDNSLVKSIWKKILSNELCKTTGSGSDRMSAVLSKVRHLALRYAKSPYCFPLEYLIAELEMVNAKLQGDKQMVPNTLVSVNVSFGKLIKAYTNIFDLAMTMEFWKLAENEFHLHESIASLIMNFVNHADSMSNIEKRQLISLSLDTLSTLLSNLYSKTNSQAVINLIRTIQGRLQRM